MEHTKTYCVYSLKDDIEHYGLTKKEMSKLVKKYEGIEDLEYFVEETIYEILGGDGINPVYGSEGMWYFPDGSSSDD